MYVLFTVTDWKKRVKKIILSFILTVCASSAFATESLDSLKERMHIYKIDSALRKGDMRALSVLPAKGYKDGIVGILKKYNVYANPAHSFADCGEGGKQTEMGKKPGCVVSLKLARKLSDGTYQDLGIRIEYAVGLGEHRFAANNSAYAQHAIDGDGWLDNQLSN